MQNTSHSLNKKSKGRTDPIVIDPDQLGQHPAVLAWFQISGIRSLPSRVEHIYGIRRKKPVYRLIEADAADRSVIAKRCYSATGIIEDKIYKKILPTLEFPAPHYYGLFTENEEFSWLFLEDVGEDIFQYKKVEHQDAAARWLGRLHSRATRLSKSFKLEGRGSDYYLNHLHAGRARILENMNNPSLREADCSVLLEMVSLLEVIALDWNNIYSACDDMPNTLVHGGIKPLNMVIGHDGSEAIVYFIDWERAGWGMPAPDLAPAQNRFSDGLINLETYWQNVREQWPNLSLPDIHRMAAIGYFLNRVAATNWATSSLSSHYTEGAVALLELYLKDLTRSLRFRSWEQ